MAPDWNSCLDGLLHGLAHAANNRVGALVALSETLVPGEPADAAVVATLRGEAARLEALLGSVRALAVDDQAVEVVHLADVVAAAVALAALHPATRGAGVVVDPVAPQVAVDAAPARVRQAVVLAVVGAAPFRAAEVGWVLRDGIVAVQLTTDGHAPAPVVSVPLTRGG
jgi:signal transduction histidine kinase